MLTFLLNSRQITRINTLFLIFLAGLLISNPNDLGAMNDPEIIQWRVENSLTFINSAFLGVLGRNPVPAEAQAWLDTEINSKAGRAYLFWSLVGSDEYKSRWGNLSAKYFVYWDTRIRNTDSGDRLCHCYYFAEFSNGFMPSPQYIGIAAPMGPFNFGVSRAVVLMYGAYDSETCSDFGCGYKEFTATSEHTNSANSYKDCLFKFCPSCKNSISLLNISADPDCERCKEQSKQQIADCMNGTGSITMNNNNLVLDSDFSNFGQTGSNWRHSGYAWWNSGYAQSTAQKVNLPTESRPQPNISTALFIQNNSGAAPHVYGTTSQKIRVVKGQTYEISLLAAAKDLGGHSGVCISVDSQWKIRPIRLNAGSYSWTQFRGSFKAVEDVVDLRIISQDVGSIYITGIILTQNVF